MKKIAYIFLAGLLSFTACQEDLLDKQPLDTVSDNTLWNDAALASAYLTQCYAEMAVFVNESPGYNVGWNGDWYNSEQLVGPFFINQIADEAMPAWGYGIKDAMLNYKAGGLKIDGGLLEWWETPYATIRKLNEFIEKVPNSPIDESTRKVRIAEARFLRAYDYFSMVKRYGGVPLITVAQKTDDPTETLYPARDTEQKVYDFVISEVDDIVADLPEVADDYGRATKYAALALKSRAALYAGSIAEFGIVQLDGLLGIPSSLASSYYQKSYDASKAIASSGIFSLYNADANKVTNFKNIFLVKGNSETILAKQHNSANAMSSGGNSWSYDFLQCPKPHSWNNGNMDGPYLEMAEEFELIDGESGKLDRTSLAGKLWSTDELWGNKDPRFFATIYTQNTPWKGSNVDFHNGIILPDGTIQKDGTYNGIAALGAQEQNKDFFTGFGVMKYLDETADNSNWISNASTDYLVFRYGETLLNLAEAAFELGNDSEALDAINQIRTRAGIATISVVDRDKIRHERKVELAFEGHRYWDLRRWRTAVTELSVSRSGIRYTLDFATLKYKVEVIPNIDGAIATPKFYDYNYYFPITLSRTGNNKNLVENPGYK